MNWFQRLFYPEELHCKSCEVLQQQLEIERARFDILLSRLALGSTNKSELSEAEDEREMKPIQTGRKFIPYAVRQQMMEEQDLATLNTLKRRHAEIHSVPTETEIEGTEKLETNEELEREILGAKI